MRFPGVILIALVLLACEGPEGPTGPAGPEGPAGPSGAPAEGILIEHHLSASAYTEDSHIIIRDSRITPKTFQALYLKVEYTSGSVAYFTPNLVYAVTDEDPPVVRVLEGRLHIQDPEEALLDLARLFLEHDDIASFGLAVLLSG